MEWIGMELGMDWNHVIALKQIQKIFRDLFVVLIFNVPFNSYGHVGKVSSPKHTFFLGRLDKAVN